MSLLLRTETSHWMSPEVNAESHPLLKENEEQKLGIQVRTGMLLTILARKHQFDLQTLPALSDLDTKTTPITRDAEGDLKKINPTVADLFKCYIQQRENNQPVLEITHTLNYYVHQARRARDTFINHNQRLVVHIASKHLNRGLAFDDLFQEGNLGLIRAIEAFDVFKANQFSTYAGFWIQLFMDKAIRNQVAEIKLSEYRENLIQKIKEFSKTFLLEHGRRPTVRQISQGIGQTEKVVHVTLQSQVWMLSLDAPVQHVHSRNEPTLGELLKNNLAKPDETVLAETANIEFQSLLEQFLSLKELQIILLRFGWHEKPELSFEEIAIKLNISKVYVRLLYSKAISKIKLRAHLFVQLLNSHS